MTTNEITGHIITSAFKVHTAVGPGLLESVYVACLRYELQKAGLSCRTEVPIPVIYDDLHLNVGFRADLIVENRVIVEVKSVEAIADIFAAQVLTYLRFSGKEVGLLINFNTKSLKDGLRRFIRQPSK